MITNNTIDSFEVRTTKFNIGKNHFFTYLQIRTKVTECMNYLNFYIKIEKNSEKSKITELYRIPQDIKNKKKNGKKNWK